MSFLPALLLAATLGTGAQAASLSAAPDRFVVTAGETFDFVLSLTDGESWQPPDVSALTRDFDIVDRRRASHAAMVNGKPVHVDQWVMTLAPKRTGTLTLPSLNVGGFASPPAQVQVVPAPATGRAQASDEPLFVRVEAADTPAFVQSDVPVTLRIYDSLGMRSGSMEKPVAEGATFTEDGGQRSYVKTSGRRRYRVIEQSYMMRPQRSGVITIPPVSLKASVPGFAGSGAASDLPGLLGRGAMGGLAERAVTVKSQPVNVTVQARPEGVSGWFLPARGVTISQEWSVPPGQMKVGDTITRTITITAKGASANQLPPIEAAPVDGLRQYEEDSHAEATLIDGVAGTVLTKRFSVVPTRPGPVSLPAIEVPWWNLAAARQEKAVLPAVTLDIRPSAESSPAPAPPPLPVAAASAPSPVRDAAVEGEGPSSLLGWLRAHRLAASVLGAVLVGVLVLAFVWRRRARAARGAMMAITPPAGARRRRRPPLRPVPHDPAQVLDDLLAACRKGEAGAAHAAYGRLVGLGAFAAPPPELDAAAEALARHLYGGDGRAWDGRAMLRALERARRQARAVKRPSGARLAPLYPGAG
ncbi:BatD family protein [Xanthobacter sp. V0B-10]|uniref:BatD family protein n=1 Tax=Xanthobacter albus TaxID=3119929 RepID=UPI0037282CB7